MTYPLHILELLLLGIIFYRQTTQTRKHQKDMANINETLVAINKRLDEASTEILALIKQLGNEQLTPEGREALEKIQATANALADIVPNDVPPAP